MTAWHMDNFSIYGTSTSFMLNGIYAAIDDGTGGNYLNLTTDPDGVSDGYVLRFRTNSGNSGSYRVAHPGGAQTVMGSAKRVWMNMLPPNDDYDYRPIRFLDNASSSLIYVGISSTGRLAIIDTGGIVATTTAPVISANGWWHLEFLADQTECELRVEGITVLGPVAHNLTTPGYAQESAIATGGSGSAQGDYHMYLKDLFCYDGAGTHNNDFVGAVIIYSLAPTADISLNWTPSTGSDGYSILDNVPPVDAQYITAGDPPPSAYVATFENLPADVTSVKAVMTFVRAAKTDGGDASLQVGLISDPDGTPATTLGTDRPITIAQTYWRDVFEEDPKTSAPWLPDAVNDAQLQIDRTT